MSAVALSHGVESRVFRHEALFYADEGEFVTAVSSFVREGVHAGEPVFVLVPAPKIEMLRWSLQGDAANVRFEDMTEMGRNPGRVISKWRDFAAEHGSAANLRGVGEPVWPGRTADELVECQRHEALLNLAFADAPLWLICPYDATTLDPSVITEATRTHPWASEGQRRSANAPTPLRTHTADPFGGALPDAPERAAHVEFDGDTLGEVRSVASRLAAEHGLTGDAREGLVLALNEVATNSVRYGGGKGEFRAWATDNSLVCEVRDGGVIADPLVGRFRPDPRADRGFGLWLANHLCDLVQIRSGPEGSVVRLQMRLREPWH
ncbi:MAG TPA: sensor histidine kinase [Actinomycetota bacterium]|nr:sensor histidine kinase [Actinomycetota bacterium]